MRFNPPSTKTRSRSQRSVNLIRSDGSHVFGILESHWTSSSNDGISLSSSPDRIFFGRSNGSFIVVRLSRIEQVAGFQSLIEPAFGVLTGKLILGWGWGASASEDGQTLVIAESRFLGPVLVFRILRGDHAFRNSAGKSRSKENGWTGRPLSKSITNRKASMDKRNL